MAGTQPHLEFIPERTTDFIFAAYSEEFGLLGNLALIVGFLLLVWRGLADCRQVANLVSPLDGLRGGHDFFTYAFVNMGMVSGILPVVGVPLPFISYGGTAMVTLGLALGVLMSVGALAAAVACRAQTCFVNIGDSHQYALFWMHIR